MNYNEGKKIALRLRDCAADMTGILYYHKLTRENVETEAMAALGDLMIRREHHAERMPGLLFEPAVNSMYEYAVSVLHCELIELANGYEHEQTDSCPKYLDDILQTTDAARRVYRPDPAPWGNRKEETQ